MMTLPPNTQQRARANRHVYRHAYPTRTQTRASTLNGSTMRCGPPRVNASAVTLRSREGRSDVNRRDLDQLVGETDLHPVDARHQPVERELPEVIHLRLKSAGRPLRDHPGARQIGLAGRHLSKHPEPPGNGAVAHFEIDLDAASLVHQSGVVDRNGTSAGHAGLESIVVDERCDEASPGRRSRRIFADGLARDAYRAIDDPARR